MDKKIEEIIIKLLLDTGLFYKREVIYTFEQEKKKIAVESQYISKPLKLILWDKGIITLANFTNMTMSKAMQKLEMTQKELEAHIEQTASNIIRCLLEEKNIEQLQKEAIKKHQELTNLLQIIRSKPTTLEYLREDLINLQGETEANTKTRFNKKTWIHCRLDLNNYEQYMLREYLLKHEKYNSPTRENSLIHITIINLYKKIAQYIHKLKYKEILNANYYRIEELDFKPETINMLKRNKLNNISDIIEYSKEEILGITEFGKKISLDIIENLEEKNIAFLNDEQLGIIVSQENAGIKKNKTK